MKHSVRTLSDPSPAPARLCFVSYPHLSELARTVFAEYAGLARIEVIEASFDPALSAALARERTGEIDAFISAGSNAAILRRAVASPVATIKVDGYDIMLALLRAQERAQRVGVVTYEGTIPELEQAKRLLNIDIAQRSYSTPHEARECFRHFAREGRRVIVGSSIAVEMAEQEGLHGILAYSAASVRQGIEDAIELARVARLESSRHEHVDAVLHTLQEAVLAVDGAHRVTAANSAMQELLGKPMAALRGMELGAVEPALALTGTLESGQGQRGQVLQLAGRDWVASRMPLLDGGRVAGAVIALHDAHTIEEADSSLRAQRRRRRPMGARYRFADLQGDSPAFRQAIAAAQRFAQTGYTVLITGESGTGKELFAQAIHHAGARAGGPFVALNCSALPETLLESELFGYEEGAFTGSRRGGKPGLFEAAHTGTLFLDEIGDMPPLLQTRLLRVLQEREVTRLGGSAAIPVDVRIIAATHQPLADMIAQRAFRADLYYRLNLLRLALPPLRERPGDVEALALAALRRGLAGLGSALPAAQVLARVLPQLRRYGWPGNVRELENICERIAVMSAQYPSVADLPLEVLAFDCPELYAQVPGRADAETVLQALQACGGNRALAAARLGISRATLWRRLQQARAAGERVPPARGARPT